MTSLPRLSVSNELRQDKSILKATLKLSTLANWLQGNECLLCILTKERVPFAGRNQTFKAKTTFSITEQNKEKRKESRTKTCKTCNKLHKKLIEGQSHDLVWKAKEGMLKVLLIHIHSYFTLH